MKASDITDSMRRCIVREPALKQPVSRTRQMPITEPETGLERVEGVNSTNVAAATGGALIAKDENYDHHIDHPTQDPKPECPVRHAPLGPNEGETAHIGRIRVRVCSYRRRLIDPDNLCAKYAIDQCRYRGFIPDDTAADIELSVSQEKVRSPEDERTEITICYPDL